MARDAKSATLRTSQANYITNKPFKVTVKLDSSGSLAAAASITSSSLPFNLRKTRFRYNKSFKARLGGLGSLEIELEVGKIEAEIELQAGRYRG